jgi:DNA-binding response OmpR family regulator
MKAHILIVEDEAILYERLRAKLSKALYTVADYAPSVTEALASIHTKRPDLVLLDINLEGEQTGFDLGKQLHDVYNIPFIYVTQYEDDATFYKGLHTNHDDFIVKTKPHLNIDELLRKMQTVLHRQQQNQPPTKQEGVMGLIGYLDDIKELDKSQVTRVPVPYQDIVFFTVRPYINENETEESLRANYLWFQTKNKDYYFLKTSLRDLQKTLPYNFVRINESYIVNIATNVMDGRINGSRLCIKNQEYTINNTYKEEVNKRLKHFYG